MAGSPFVVIKVIDDNLPGEDTLQEACDFTAVHSKGWKIILFYLWIPSAEFSRERVRQRVADGGHNIPDEAIARRYNRTVSNFINVFAPSCDEVMCYDNSRPEPLPVFADFEGERTVLDDDRYQSILRSYHE